MKESMGWMDGWRGGREGVRAEREEKGGRGEVREAGMDGGIEDGGMEGW